MHVCRYCQELMRVRAWIDTVTNWRLCFGHYGHELARLWSLRSQLARGYAFKLWSVLKLLLSVSEWYFLFTLSCWRYIIIQTYMYTFYFTCVSCVYCMTNAAADWLRNRNYFIENAWNLKMYNIYCCVGWKACLPCCTSASRRPEFRAAIAEQETMLIILQIYRVFLY